MPSNIPGNVRKHSGECPKTIKRIPENILEHVAKHPVESIKAFQWMYIIVLDPGYHELLPTCWRTATAKFYCQAAGFHFALAPENCGWYLKKEVNQKEEIEGKRALWWRCQDWSFVVDHHF